MKRIAFLPPLVLGLAALVSTAEALRAQSAVSPAEPVVRVTVTVTSNSKTPPPVLNREDIIVRVGDDRRPVLDWIPAQGGRGGLDLAILVDDSLDTTVGIQFGDLNAFIRSLPANTRVAVAYSSNGSARMLQNFTSEHEQAVKALRITSGRIDMASGLYLSLVDLLQHWPVSDNRSAVLLISDGIDLLRDVENSSPGLNMDLQRAIEEAQRRGVPVYTLFASGGGRLRRNHYLIMNGQGCLARLSFETGGESFTQGFETPIAFQPFLQDVVKLLGQQYLLSFRVHPGKKPGFERLRITSEQSGVEIVAPTRVYIPAAP